MAAAGLEPAAGCPAASSTRPATPPARELAAGPLPDAVLAVNDEAAIGLLTGCAHAGVDVPGASPWPGSTTRARRGSST